MNELDVTDFKSVLERIRAQVDIENIRVTQHAQQEMVEEDITLDEVIEAIGKGQILENYPKHRRGACCLLNGLTQKGRPLHIVYARQHDEYLSLLQSMKPSHQSG